ncbi:MAG: NAD(P)H-hydrate dehydratase [Arcticibacter sp.]
MENLLNTEQMRATDAHTIEATKISSLELMEKASKAFVQAFMSVYSEKFNTFAVYCGTGNNGGDGLAIARLLHEEGYRDIHVRIIRFTEKSSADFQANLEALRSCKIPVQEIRDPSELGEEPAVLLIDAMLGSGLNKPLSGKWAELVTKINSWQKKVVAVDMPTGFRGEGPLNANDLVVRAKLAITFQRPKINFLLPDSASFMEEFRVVDIGLEEAYLQNLESPYKLIQKEDIVCRLKKRSNFSHKGTYGHALLVAGSPETMGAALLSAEACLYTGAGLTTACIPEEGLNALNSRSPEIMALIRKADQDPEIKVEKYSALGIGPGLGTGDKSLRLLTKVMRSYSRPIVFDADALNLIADNYELVQLIPEGSILTPHMKEFDRLFGEHKSWWERLESGRDRATTLGCTIVLKNRYTMIFLPDGRCLFNPTGSPAMASGGMGDVLTGVITSFLAQGYKPEDAAIAGVYIHGAVADHTHDYVIPASALLQKLPSKIADYLT